MALALLATAIVLDVAAVLAALYVALSLKRRAEWWVGAVVLAMVAARRAMYLITALTDEAVVLDPRAEATGLFVSCALAAVVIGTAIAALRAGRQQFALLEAEERYRAVFRNDHTIMLVTDPETLRIVDANEAAEAFYGHTRDELASMSITDIDTAHPEIIRARAQAVASGEPQIVHTQHRTANGQYKDVELHLGIIVVAGKTLKLDVVFDLTPLSRQRELLERVRARYSALFDNMQSAFAYCRVMSDDRGHAIDFEILDVNKAFEKMFGVEKIAVLGHAAREVMPALHEDSLDWVATFADVASSGDSIKFKAHSSAYGAWVSVSAYSMEPGFFAAIVSDVSQEKASEQRLESLIAERTRDLDTANADLAAANEELTALNEELVTTNEDLQAALEDLREATSARDRFFASASHELRTPLNSIIGFSGVMLQGMTGPLNEEQTRQLDMVHRAGKHLLAIVNDILDLAKLESSRISVQWSEAHPSQVVRELADSVAVQAKEKSLALRVQVCDECDIALLTDKTRLTQVVEPVLSNAIKFTDEGYVSLECSCEDNHVKLTVRDSGIGIAPEDLDLIFEPYSQLAVGGPDSGDGTGLGLAVTRGLVQALRGTIEVESEPGAGSVFAVTLPARTSET